MSSNIGNNIRKARKANGFSQKKLADKSGIAQNSIGNYERGERSPTMAVVEKIAKALEIELDELVDLSVSDEMRNKMNQQSHEVAEAINKKFIRIRIATLEEKKTEVQQQIDVLLNETQIDGETIRILMKEKNTLEIELFDLKIKISKESEVNSSSDYSLRALYISVGVFAEMLEFLFSDGKINPLYDESKFFDISLKRISSFGIDNFQKLFPDEEKGIWVYAFGIIKSIKIYLDDENDSTEIIKDLVAAISKFYSHQEIGIDSIKIAEKFSKLLPEIK